MPTAVGRPESRWLFERLREHGQTPLLAGLRPATYADLVDRIGFWAERLHGAGLPPGAVVAIDGDFQVDAAALLLATVGAGCIALPLSTWAEGQREELARSVGAAVHVRFRSGEPSWTTGSATAAPDPLVERLGRRGHGGLVLFTSGTSGRAKAALYSFEDFVRRYERVRSPARRLSVFQFDHTGGLGVLFRVLAGGGTLVAVQTPGDPDCVCAAIGQHGIQVIVASPTFLRMLLVSGAHRRHDLGCLRRVFWSSEPMPPPILRALQRELPDVEFGQTYGLTEFGVLASRTDESDPSWIRLDDPSVEVRVQDGTLRLRGERAMLGYLDGDNPFDADGWYDTGDLVEVRGPWLRFCGRRSEVINVGGHKVVPHDVESALLELSGVASAVVRARPNPVTGQVVCATVVLTTPETPVEFRRRARASLRGRLAPHEVPAVFTLDERVEHSERLKSARGPVPASPASGGEEAHGGR